MRVIKASFEFQWDKGNIEKNKIHKVEIRESEEVFFDQHRFIFKDRIHSGTEERFRILGKTKKGRLLFVVFTKRGKKIRIISARDINKKEVYLYEKKINSTKI
ncbi:MAG TPA: BrnT family toxin [Xanthomonadales bacterium]|nr:BrnT family toxin [Xanthomonadales bacterium]